ncbi:MAG: phosphate signaling complex protein PhoU [Nitrosomonadales bacterium]|nr:phosphate signaling complex protein PhoU [Nitrosomonadales bacterium]
MMGGEHTSKRFDAELEAVRSLVLQMGGLVERQVQQSMSALIAGDVALLTTIVDNDYRVNALEVEIDEVCNRIIACRQPAASDLRVLMSVIKIITDLERIGDAAKKIARMGLRLSGQNPFHFPRYRELNYATSLALDMLHNALDAFARLDLNLSIEVVRQDEKVDEEFHSIMRYLISFMMEDPRTISTSLEILFVAKAIERIGDHAKNIAEYLVYLVKGRDIRHTSVKEFELEVRKAL